MNGPTPRENAATESLENKSAANQLLRPRWQYGGSKCLIFLPTIFPAKTPWVRFEIGELQVSYLSEEVDKDTGRTTAWSDPISNTTFVVLDGQHRASAAVYRPYSATNR